MSVGDRVSVRFEADVTAFNATLRTTTLSLQGFVTTLGQVKATAAGGLVGGKDPLGGLTAAMSNAETKATSFGSKLKGLGSAIAGQATSFGVASASIWGAYNAYDNLIKVELRAQTAHNRVSTMTTTLATLEERRRVGLEKGNLTVEEATLLDEKIANTKAKLATAQIRETDLQGDVNEAWAGFASQIGPQVVAAGASILQLVTNLNASLPKSGGVINALKNAFINLIPSIRTAKSESLLLGPAIDGAGLSFSKLKGTVPAVEQSVVGLASGLGPLTLGFNKTEKGSESLGKSLGGLKGKLGGVSGIIATIGGAAAGAVGGLALSDLAAQTQKVFDKYAKGYDPKKRVSALEATFGTPEQQKAYVAETEENQKKLAESGVNVLDMLTDYFFGTDRVDKKLQAYNATVKTAGASTAAVVPSLNKAATSTNGMVDAVIVLQTKMQQGLITHNQYIDGLHNLAIPGKEFTAIMDEVRVRMNAGAVSANAWKSQAIGLSTSFVDLNKNWHATGMEIAAYEANIMKAALATGTFTDITQKQKDVIESTRNFHEQYVTTLENEHETLDKEAISLGAGAGALAQFAVSSKRGSLALEDSNRAHKLFNISLAAGTGYITEAGKQQDTYIDGVYKGVKAATEWAKAMMIDVQAEISQRTQLQVISTTMGDYGNLLVFSTGKMQELITVQRQMIKGHVEEQIAIAKNTDWINNEAIIRGINTVATLTGTRAANDWLASAIASSAAAKAQEAQLRKNVEALTHFKDLNDLTNEELQTMAARFLETKSGADAFGVVMSARLTPALETFSSLINSTDMKAFNEEWKKMNFGSIPKGARGDFKDMFKELMGVADKSTGIVTAIDAVFTAILTGSKKVKNSDIRTVFKEINNDLDDLAKVNKSAVGLGGLFEPLEKLKGKNLEAFIFKFGDSLNELKKAMADKWIDPQEKLDILTKYSDAANISGDAIQKLGEKIGLSQEEINRWKVADAASDTDKLGTAAGGAAPAVGTLADNILKSGGTAVDARAKVDLVTGAFDVLQATADKTNPAVKVNPQPALDSMTKTTNTFGTWFDMVQRSNPAMKANPSAALTAINKVSTVFGVVFDTIQRSNPAMKVNNSNAINGIKAVQSAIDNLPKEKSTTLTVNHVDTFKTVHLRHGGSFISQPGFQHGGSFIATQHQNFKGAEIAEFNKPELVTVTPLTNPNDITDRTIRIQADHVDRFQKQRASGPIHVYIDSPIYLYPSGEMVGRMQRKYVLDSIGKYPIVQ